MCRAALPHLRDADHATIVNIASGQALSPNAVGVAAYAATKAGLVAFTKALRAELAPTSRADAVAPGIVDTPMVRGVLGGYTSPDDAPFVQQYAMRRVARPAELAEAILFLTSDASSYVTGTVLAVGVGVRSTVQICTFESSQYRARSTRLSSLPLGMRGSSSTKSTLRGHLYFASCAWQCVISASARCCDAT